MQLFSRNRLLMKHIKKGSPEKPGSLEADCLGLEETDGAYIMPMPPCGIAGIGLSDLISATTDSVVSNVEATLVAF